MSVLKKIGQGLSWAYKPAVDVKSWMGLDIIKSATRYVWQMAKNVFVPQKAERKETFQEALVRLNLTEADLKNRQKEFSHLFLIYGAIGVVIVLYSLFLFYTLSFMGGILSLVVAALAFGVAFRYHFWLFQIKHRKLGCSLQEWWHSKIDNASPSKKEGKPQ